jgi:hypothetical protein
MYKDIWDSTMSLYEILFEQELLDHGPFKNEFEKVNFINKLLHNHTEVSLIELGKIKSKQKGYNIEIHKDTHYREIYDSVKESKMLSINELLYTY